jgi:hypothetical protein
MNVSFVDAALHELLTVCREANVVAQRRTLTSSAVDQSRKLS